MWVQAADPCLGPQWAFQGAPMWGSPVQNPRRAGGSQLGCVRGLEAGGRPPVWTGGGAAVVPECLKTLGVASSFRVGP